MVNLSDILAQPLEPLVSGPAGADIVVHDTIKDNRRAGMHAHEPRHLYDNLEVIGHSISDVEASISSSLLRNSQKLVQLVSADARALGSELGQPLVGLVAGLVHDVDVEVGLLVLEEGGAEVPELGRVELQHGQCGLVDERRGRVPWLNLLAEDDLHLACELRIGPNLGGNRGHEVVEDLCGVALSVGFLYKSYERPE